MLTGNRRGGAVQWLREEDGDKKISNVFSMSSTRNDGLRYAMAPPVEIKGRNLPQRVLPVSRAVPVTGSDSRSGSDMDISSDSNDISLISSPQDVDTQSGVGIDGKGGKRAKPAGITSRVKDELSDSASSTEASFPHCRSSDGSDGRFSGIRSREDFGMTAKKDLHCGRLQKEKLSYVDFPNATPSAPPFLGSFRETKQVSEQSWSSRPRGSPCFLNSEGSVATNKQKTRTVGTTIEDSRGKDIPDLSSSHRVADSTEVNETANSWHVCRPNFHASGLGPWCAVISYDACVRLCLHSWAMGCVEEAPYFLDNECALLRNAFGLQHVLLQPEEELLAKQSSELVTEAAAPKPKKTIGKMKVQVRKVKMGLDPPPGCRFSSLKLETVKLEVIHQRFSNLNSTLCSGWEALRKVRVTSQIPENGSFSQQSLAYVQAGTQYLKQVTKLLKNGVTKFRNSSTPYEVVPETCSCLLKLKSSCEEDVIRMQPGSGETHVFLPDGLGDDLSIEVHDSKGKCYGRALVQVAVVSDDPGDKLRWWPIYHEPEHELVGRIQLHLNYSTSQDESNYLKHGSVAETIAYDLVLEVAMKVQHFQARNLLLSGPWKWLVIEFASYYGVSDAYTKLRYLSYVMDVATPTEGCLTLVHDLLFPLLMKGDSKLLPSMTKGILSHQENRMLGEIEGNIQKILTTVFENYKSLDESSPSGMIDVFRCATGTPAPALKPAVKLYGLLHDILSPEAQLKFCRYFQAAAKKRSRRHLAETDDLVLSNNVGSLIDPMTLLASYQKMKSLIFSIKNEISTDIEIQNQNVLPSFIDLPNLSASIYNVELCSRLRAFLDAYPPSGPSPPVIELVIATADFQRDLSSWNMNPVKGGVDAKELFHTCINSWIEDKRQALLRSCKVDKEKWSTVKTQHSTTPFIEEMYEQIMEALNEYDIIICLWPDFAIILEKVIADVEKAIAKALEKQYGDITSPLKDSLTPKIPGFKYVQKFAKGTASTYSMPDELGVLLNSMKRMLDVLHVKIETKFKSWCSCTSPSQNSTPGEHLSEITVMLRADFRNYTQAIVEKLVDNTRVQNATKLKKIIQDSKETVVEAELRTRIQPLKDLLIETVNHIHSVFEPHLFIIICRTFWDRMGQDILCFLENGREKNTWYKCLRIAVSILDEIFESQLQKLLGNAVQEKDLEPPRSVMEVHSMLCKDSVNHKENNYYY